MSVLSNPSYQRFYNMSEVNSHEVNSSKLLSPIESLPKYHEDTPEQKIARDVYSKMVRERLESLNTGFTDFQGTDEVVLKIRNGGKFKEIVLPIKAIPSDTLTELLSVSQKLASKIPRKRYDDGGWDQDPDHPRFSEAVEAFTVAQKKLRFDKILHAIDIPLRDADGNIVWDCDEDGHRDYDGAIKALKRLKLSEKHLIQIDKAIDRLSIEIELDDEEEYTKKS